MFTEFTALAFGFCALFWHHPPPIVIVIGHVIEEKCVPQIITDRNGAGTIDGHEVTARFLRDTAIITVDGMEYIVRRGVAL